MSDRDESGIDLDHANAARMYDYFLGGAHHFAVDRRLGDRVLEANPSMVTWARENRSFLLRVVRYCVEQGVDQFLDLGSGIPTAGHVHEIARKLAPQARVAYVDFDPVAVAHSGELLAGVPGVSITHADVRDPAAVLGAPTVTEVLDFGRPVAVLAVAIMHFVADADDPVGMIDGYRRALVPGSYVAITHGSDDQDDPVLAEKMAHVAAVYHRSATPGHVRSRAGIREILGGLELVEPGLVDAAHWHPGPDPGPAQGSYAAVAHVP